MVTTYEGSISYTAILITIRTHTCNTEKLCVIKYPELNKFRMPAMLTKLKLITHFGHVTLVTPPIYGNMKSIYSVK